MPCLLEQVYRARLAATGEEVAVKVQRPAALSTISKVCSDTRHFAFQVSPDSVHGGDDSMFAIGTVQGCHCCCASVQCSCADLAGVWLMW